MTTPYVREIEFMATGGEDVCVTLPAPGKGVIHRIIVKQLGGTLEGYSLDLFDRADCCAGAASLSLNLEDLSSRIDADLHKIIATRTVAAPNASLELFDLEQPYANRDEQDKWQRRTTNAIYLNLRPAGTGEKSFAIAYTIVEALFN
jgi:hypothetical protein